MWQDQEAVGHIFIHTQETEKEKRKLEKGINT